MIAMTAELRDRLAERRPDRLVGEVVADAEALVERRCASDLGDLVGLERLGRDLEDVLAELAVVDALDLRVGEARRREHTRGPFSLAGRSRPVLMRVPDSKSMPKFRPLPPIASAPTSRIIPDIEKNHFEAPMKSKVIGGASAHRRPARSGARAGASGPSCRGSPASPARP